MCISAEFVTFEQSPCSVCIIGLTKVIFVMNMEPILGVRSDRVWQLAH